MTVRGRYMEDFNKTDRQNVWLKALYQDQNCFDCSSMTAQYARVGVCQCASRCLT